MNGYIYVLHFEEKLAHAQHYVGSTRNLQKRLIAHANGAGSNLCRVLGEKGIEWKLGGLHVTHQAGLRRLERQLKDQCHAHRYCAICSPLVLRLGESRPMPMSLIPFATDSRTLRCETQKERINASVRFTSDVEPETTIKLILSLMDGDKDALGFIPCGGKQGIKIIHDKGLVAIVSANGEDTGYAAFTLSMGLNRVNIHQCCVRDDARLYGHGKALVDAITQKFPRHFITAKVRRDLAANHFWEAIGFALERESNHLTSNNKINHYLKQPLFI